MSKASDTTALTKSPRWPDIERAVGELIRSRRSENTRRAYQSDWDRWLAYTRANATDLRVPGLGATTTFRDELGAAGFSGKTVGRILSTLSFLYGALRDTALVQHNPFSKAWLPRPDATDVHKTPAVADNAVLTIMQSFADDMTPSGIRDRAIFHVLYDTGIRRSSLVDLRRDQLRREGELLTAIVTVKGKREERVEFTDDACRALEAWIAAAPSSAYVFPGRDPENPIDLGTINNVIHRRARRVGLQGVTPHQFRAAFITTGFDAEINPRSIQAAAHHKSLSTTDLYDRHARGGTVVEQISNFRRTRRLGVATPKPPPTRR